MVKTQIQRMHVLSEQVMLPFLVNLGYCAMPIISPKSFASTEKTMKIMHIIPMSINQIELIDSV